MLDVFMFIGGESAYNLNVGHPNFRDRDHVQITQSFTFRILYGAKSDHISNRMLDMCSFFISMQQNNKSKVNA